VVAREETGRVQRIFCGLLYDDALARLHPGGGGGVTERCRLTLGTSSTYQNKKNVHINMFPETFNL
jgi:hypothetical protein